MSNALLQQLLHILAPWDRLDDTEQTGGGAQGPLETAGRARESSSVTGDANDESTDFLGSARPKSSSETSSVPLLLHFGEAAKPQGAGQVSGTPGTPSSTSRTASTRLELARAAAALFTSNAGVFRPVLVRIFTFLFNHIDDLVDEQTHLQLCVRRPAGDAGSFGDVHLGSGRESSAEDQTAVAAAFEKVRRTEARMSALVEEASVQRDYFTAQVQTHKDRERRLEMLLQHQMELTQALMDHGLRMDVIGGGHRSLGGGGALSADGGDGGMATGMLEGGQKLSFAEAVNAMENHHRMSEVGGVTSSLQSGMPRGLGVDRRDAAYVQRLITRAENELALEQVEEQLRQLRVEQDDLQKRVQLLLRLNSRYARQSIELSARLSILHDHNVALATDAQLYQRDCVRENQRVARLQHDLQIARHMVLTLMQVQQRSGDATDGGEVDRGKQSSPDRGRRRRGSNSLGETGRRGSLRSLLLSTSNGGGDSDGSASQLTLAPEDQVEEAISLLPDRNFQRQLQDLLAVSDAKYAGMIKSALLQILNLQKNLSERRKVAGSASSIVTTRSVRSLHLWAPPYGQSDRVPRHLRSRLCIPLVSLHPLVAEIFVHELLSQRQELLQYRRQHDNAKQREQQEQQQSNDTTKASGQGKQATRGRRKTSSISPSANPSNPIAKPKKEADGGVAATSTATSASNANTGSSGASDLNDLVHFTSPMPLEEFIELFVLVIWLNCEDRFRPLLSPAVRERLEEESKLREMAQGTGSDVTPLAPMLDLRDIFHSVRPPAEFLRLPTEGLQLTYALDVASRRPDAGILTYIYGLTSRGEVSEALFDLLQFERNVFLEMCRRVDAVFSTRVALEMSAKSPTSRRKGSVPGTGKPTVVLRSPLRQGRNGLPSTHATRGGAPWAETRSNLRGCIPSALVARILMTMYPAYPIEKLQQLVEAAVEDGTEGKESPATVFYEVLIPERLLPGAPLVASRVISGLSEVDETVGGVFAASFYMAVCEDALESMQLVQDSVDGYAKGDGASSTGGGSADNAVVSATAQQLSSMAFLGIPQADEKRWGPALRSAMNRWPLLRASTTDEPAAVAETRSKRAGGSSTQRPESEDVYGYSMVSSIEKAAVSQVMPYLRRHLVLRRGQFSSPPGKSAPLTTDDSGVVEPTSLPPPPPTWTPAQEGMLEKWDSEWQRCSSATLDPQRLTDYLQIVREADPQRHKAWGVAALALHNPVIHDVLPTLT